VPVLPLDRNLARAKALLQTAGQPHPAVTLMATNSSEALQVAQVLQQMVAEAGFDLKIEATEFTTALTRAQNGDFEAFLIGWTGATDVDRNIYQFVVCNGSLNNGKYCAPEIDRLLEAERGEADPAKRLAIMGNIAALTTGRDRPLIYLYHSRWFYAHSAKLTGFVPYPEGVPRINFTDLE
jgi:peptide/nickel transport system substrate-binding protein